MKLLILGASGGVGRWATRLASEQGHDITAMVRPRSTFDAPAGVRVIRGQALNVADLKLAVEGQQALISCLGAQRVNPRNPWSRMREPRQVAGPGAVAIVQAVMDSTVRRVVAISAAGVGDSLPATNAVMRWLLRKSNIGQQYADLFEMEETLRASTLDWIAVRPVTLSNGALTGRARVVSRFGTMSMIRRADVAQWLIRTATSTDPIVDRTPMIG